MCVHPIDFVLRPDLVELVPCRDIEGRAVVHYGSQPIAIGGIAFDFGLDG